MNLLKIIGFIYGIYLWDLDSESTDEDSVLIVLSRIVSLCVIFYFLFFLVLLILSEVPLLFIVVLIGFALASSILDYNNKNIEKLNKENKID